MNDDRIKRDLDTQDTYIRTYIQRDHNIRVLK